MCILSNDDLSQTIYNTSIPLYSYHFLVCVVRTLKTSSLSKFQICNTALLSSVYMLHIVSQEPTQLITESCTFRPSSPPPSPSPQKPSFYSLCFCKIDFLRFHVLSEIMKYLSSWVWLIPPSSVLQIQSCY